MGKLRAWLTRELVVENKRGGVGIMEEEKNICECSFYARLQFYYNIICIKVQ